MSKTFRPEADGYAVEVSLLKLKPRALALAAACFATTVVLLGWLGSGAGAPAASHAETNDATSAATREARPATPNNATNQAALVANNEDRKDAETASQTSAESQPAPGPSPAGFAETAAPEAAPTVAPSSTTSSTSAPTTGGGYTVQAGSYNTVSEANERVSALRAAGFEARAAAVELAGRGTWHRVYTGRFQTRAEAVAHDKKLRASGAVSATIVTPVQD